MGKLVGFSARDERRGRRSRMVSVVIATLVVGATLAVTGAPAEAVNAPVTRRDLNRTNPGASVTTRVVANDFDPDGHPFGVASVDAPANGTATLSSSMGSVGGGTVYRDVRYVPDAGFTGVETITYTVRDSTERESTGTLQVAVSATSTTNQRPVANPDYRVIAEGDTLSFTAADLLANDTDPQGQDLTLLAVSDSTHGGEVTGDPATGYTYTPRAGFTGADHIRYAITDTDGNVNTLPGPSTTGSQGTLYIQVEAHDSTNNPPITRRDLNRTNPGAAVSTNVVTNDFDPDGDAVTMVSVEPPANGTITSFNTSSISYRPDPDFVGVENVTYTLRDSEGLLSTGTLQVAVSATNTSSQRPVANPDYRVIAEGDTLSFTAADLLANDTDPQGQDLTLLAVSDSTHGGEVTGDPATGYTYTPRAGFTGADHIRYAITDTDGNVNTLPGPSTTGSQGTLYIQVEAHDSTNNPPITRRDLNRTNPGAAVSTNVVTNDFDPDGDAVTMVSVEPPANGTITSFNTSSISYRPDPDFVGVENVTYTLRDSEGLLSTGTLQVAVSATSTSSQRPVANRDFVDLDEATGQATFTAADLLANDTDPQGQDLTLLAVSDSTHGGEVTGDPATGYTYTPPSGLDGTDYIRYAITDTDGNVNTFGSETSETGAGYVEIRYAPPVAVADMTTTPADTAVQIDVLGNDLSPMGWDLTIASFEQPANGTVQCEPLGPCTYQPDVGFSGADQFHYVISDATGNTSRAVVVVAVDIDTHFAADVVFAIDESGSMSSAFDQLRANLSQIAGQLVTSGLDTRLGVVGYGANAHAGHPATRPHVHTTLTDLGGFHLALGELVASGGTEPALEAIEMATSEAMDFREGAGVCVVVVTDEPTNGDQITYDDALAALGARDATLFSIGRAAAPDPTDGLVAATGGAAFPISGTGGFLDNPTQVLEPLLQGCAGSIVEGIHLLPAETTLTVGDTHTVTALLRDSAAQPVVGTTVDFEVTSGPHAGTVQSVVTDAAGEADFDYTGSAPGDDVITASFTDSITGHLRSTQATATWEPPPNAPPVAVDDAYVAPAGSLAVAAPGVLANDSDPDGNPITAQLVSDVSDGILALAADGSFTYQASAGFVGTDSFTYRAVDDQGATSEPATVTIEATSSDVTVTGIVTAEATGAPVSGATVFAMWSTGAWELVQATTGPDGTYQLGGIDPHSPVRVLVMPPAGSNLVTVWRGGGWDAGQATTVSGDPGATLSGVDVALPTGSSVAGTVTAAGGEPLASVTVTAHRLEDVWVPVGVTTTDTDGTYRLDGLIAGEYHIRFAPDPGSGLVGQWYQGALGRGEAQLVSTSAGQTVSGIDASFETSSVSGSVTDESGVAVEGVVVHAFAPGDTWVGSTQTVTSADGTYQFVGLEPGSYLVYFVPPADSDLARQWYDDAALRGQATPVVIVENGTLTDVDAVLTRIEEQSPSD